MNSTYTLPVRRQRSRALALLAHAAPGALAAAILCLPASAAFAQTVPAEAAATDQIPAETASEALTGDIVVNGRRQQNALAEEHDAVGVIDIVTTGDVAIHSQTGIADLAKTLPGISVSRDQGRNQSATGEAQYVSIRGFDTSYNAYTLDGLRLPQVAGNSRAISLNLFSPFAVGAIAVDKTPGAAKDSDSIAGIVDLRTPTAFDFSTDFTRARVLAQGAQLALDRKQKGFGGAVGIDAARRFGSDRQFGVYVAGYYEERANAAESTAVQNDYKTTNFNVGTARANGDALSADGVQWNFYDNEIKRYGASGSLDFHSDPVELFARVNYATYLNTNTMNQTGLRNELTRGQTNSNPVRTLTGGGTTQAYNAAGIYTPLGINPASYFRTEDVEQELFSAQVGGKAHWNGFTASLEGAYADGRFDQPQRIEAAFRGVAYNGAATNTGLSSEGVVVDLSNPRSPRPVLSSGASAYVGSLDRPTQLYVQQGYDYLSEVKKTVKGSVGWEGTGVLASIAVGGLYEDSDRDGRSLSPDVTRYRFLTPLQAGTVQGPTINQYLGYVLKDFLDYYPSRGIKVLERSQLDSQVSQYMNLATVSQQVINQGLLKANEKRKAVYGTATLKLGTLEVVPGVRYEDNSFDARYFSANANGIGGSFVNAGRNYDHLDPSVLAAWKPDDRFVVRGAIRSSYARPGFDQIAGPTRRSDADSNGVITVTRPNPDLKPVEAWSYDAGVEYYGGVGRYLQVALYYKDLKNILVPTGTRSLSETVGNVVTIQPVNGRGGNAKGVEASGRFTIGDMVGSTFLGNFGVGGNITYQRTEANYQISATDIRRSSLPQAPDLIYNAEVFYADGKVRTNLSYNHTGRFLSNVQDSQPDIYVQPVGELNFGLAFAATDNLEIGVAARNLLDQHTYWATVGKSERYISNDRNGGYMKTGRVFQFSLTMKM
ncbi:TonB-dependent receptor [Sphingomonas sp. CFBP 13728]|uniref:TonB-dependent receptor n=1 Tax=Sphingomonas sp. CFBP 13728 TaxID=2775294 RepID=UPI001786653B|nr:TonB-dependent receptor [Sphingomonas sp. CFBP 13728]MBD8617708.1 TonB-dependent receptor [Sphingomonas sp. CFBP 13728]